MPRRQEDRHDAERIAGRVGGRLKEVRRRLRWTQEEVSERIGLTAEAYARIERGHSLPSFPTLLRLCDVLQARPDELLIEADPLDPPGTDTEPPAQDQLGDRRQQIAALNADLQFLDGPVLYHLVSLARSVRLAVDSPGRTAR